MLCVDVSWRRRPAVFFTDLRDAPLLLQYGESEAGMEEVNEGLVLVMVVAMLHGCLRSVSSYPVIMPSSSLLSASTSSRSSSSRG